MTLDARYKDYEDEIAEIENSSPAHREHLARSASTPDAILWYLAEHDIVSPYFLLTNIASNIGVPMDLMVLLSMHSSDHIRQNVARNKKCPLELLNILCLDDNLSVRAKAVRNLNADLSTFTLYLNSMAATTRYLPDPDAMDYTASLGVLYHFRDIPSYMRAVIETVCPKAIEESYVHHLNAFYWKCKSPTARQQAPGV